jgi:peroxiredoxin
VVNWRQLAGVFLILALALAACAGSGSTGSQGVLEGKEAIGFTLEDLDGNEVSLSDYRGSVVLLNFWATWCPPCMAEIPDFEQAYRARQGDGFVVLGINVEEPPELVKPFADELDVTYPLLLDQTGEVMKAYRAPGLPVSLVVDREGVIQARHVGYLSAGKLDEYLSKVLQE